MTLSDALAKRGRNQTGLPCSVAQLLNSLTPADRKALQNALDGNLSSAEIYWALVEEGHQVGKQTVRRHRAGECRCPVERPTANDERNRFANHLSGQPT